MYNISQLCTTLCWLFQAGERSRQVAKKTLSVGTGYYCSVEVKNRTYLPVDTEGLLLRVVQRSLEHTAFDYASRHLPPDVLTKEGILGSNSVELTHWGYYLYNVTIQKGNALIDEVPIDVKFEWLSSLRHDAVHRNRICIQHLVITLTDAIKVSLALEDPIRSPKLQAILRNYKRSYGKPILILPPNFLNSRNASRNSTGISRIMSTSLDAFPTMGRLTVKVKSMMKIL